MDTDTETGNYINVPDEFYGDKTSLTSYETTYFSLLVMLAKLMIFNAIKFFIKPALRLSYSTFFKIL